MLLRSDCTDADACVGGFKHLLISEKSIACAADSCPARADAGWHQVSAERGPQPMGQSPANAPLQRSIHASHLPADCHALRSGCSKLFASKMSMPEAFLFVK